MTNADVGRNSTHNHAATQLLQCWHELPSYPCGIQKRKNGKKSVLNSYPLSPLHLKLSRMIAKLASIDFSDLVPNHPSNTMPGCHELFQQLKETLNRCGSLNSFPLFYAHLGIMGNSNATLGTFTLQV